MSDETVQPKITFEWYSEERGVPILHYHADNVRFADNGFIENCQLKNQCLTYCSINVHFQNGIAEKKIQDLQEATRTSLRFALHKWPHMLSIHLWPYAMHMANEIMISTPTKDSDKSPQELFSWVNVSPKIKHFHTIVEKLQFFLFLSSCSQGILNASWLSWPLLLKIACLHVSFTAYENFYKLSKMHCLLVLTFHFPIFRMSECRNPAIKHIFTYTLISPFICTYVTDLFLVILFT